MPVFRLTIERVMTEEVYVTAENQDEAEALFFDGDYELIDGTQVTHDLAVIAFAYADECEGDDE